MFVTRPLISNKKNAYFCVGNNLKNGIMAKKKAVKKAKEPIRLRFKELADGNKSLYLDTYTGMAGDGMNF